MLTTQNFYSHPDSLRDQLFGTPTQGRAGLGPPIPLPGLNSQGASGPLHELRLPSPFLEPKEGNRPGVGQQRIGLPELGGWTFWERNRGGGCQVCFPGGPLAVGRFSFLEPGVGRVLSEAPILFWDELSQGAALSWCLEGPLISSF